MFLDMANLLRERFLTGRRDAAAAWRRDSADERIAGEARRQSARRRPPGAGTDGPAKPTIHSGNIGGAVVATLSDETKEADAASGLSDDGAAILVKRWSRV
jgi:hypothetical protein